MDDFTGSLEELEFMSKSEREGITELNMDYQDLDNLTKVMKLTKGCNFTKLNFGTYMYFTLCLLYIIYVSWKSITRFETSSH